MAALNWKASERCTTAPGPSSDRSLANVKFRLTMNETFTPEEVRRIDGMRNVPGFNPELLLEVDAATLSSDTGIVKEEIVVSVIVRDRDLGKFEKMRQWPLDELPGDLYALGALNDFSCAARLDVVVVATPSGSFRNDDSRRSGPGTLLASKVFKIRSTSQSVDFPIKFVTPEEMEKDGFYRSTVCCVKWRGEDISRLPSELLEVWLNKDFEDKYRALNARHRVAAMDQIGFNIAAHVYQDVLAHVLGSEDDTDEPDSLVGVVKDMIGRELGMTLEEARRIYQQGPAGRSRLGPWCWKLTRADQAFARLTA